MIMKNALYKYMETKGWDSETVDKCLEVIYEEKRRKSTRADIKKL